MIYHIPWARSVPVDQRISTYIRVILYISLWYILFSIANEEGFSVFSQIEFHRIWRWISHGSRETHTNRMRPVIKSGLESQLLVSDPANPATVPWTGSSWCFLHTGLRSEKMVVPPVNVTSIVALTFFSQTLIYANSISATYLVEVGRVREQHDWIRPISTSHPELLCLETIQHLASHRICTEAKVPGFAAML